MCNFSRLTVDTCSDNVFTFIIISAQVITSSYKFNNGLSSFRFLKYKQYGVVNLSYCSILKLTKNTKRSFQKSNMCNDSKLWWHIYPVQLSKVTLTDTKRTSNNFQWNIVSLVFGSSFILRYISIDAKIPNQHKNHIYNNQCDIHIYNTNTS